MSNSLSNFSPTIESSESFSESFSKPYLTLPPQIFAQVFPFHFVFNSDRIIVQCGEVLQRIMPDIIGSHFKECFQIKRPIINVDVSDFNKQSRSVFIIESLHNGLFLKGQMTSIADENIVFFLGSPVVTEVGNLNKIGIKIKDFAVHDAVADFLFLLQTKNKLRDELTERQVKLKDALREKEEIALLAEERARTIEKTLDKLKKTQSQLIQSEKMSGLGQLVAGIAHEINNPISFIHGNIKPAHDYASSLMELIHLYQTYYPTPPPIISEFIENIELDYLTKDFPKLLESVKFGAARITDIVKSLRIFSRPDEAGLKAIDLHENIDSTLAVLQNRLNGLGGNPEILVIKNYGDLPFIEAYGGLLNQVFMNLLVNAIDAIEQHQNSLEPEQRYSYKGMITITTTMINATNQALISIEDNGSGMSSQVQEKIFNPFFTTKPVGKGTGMGLAISYQIMEEKHHGNISVNSTPDQGTEFVITLPIKQFSVAIMKD